MKNFFFYCIAAILCSLVVVNCDEMDDFFKYNEECLKEISDKKAAGLLKRAPSYDDPEWWCNGACVSRKLGLMVDGKTVTEKLVGNILKIKEGGDKDLIKAEAEACIEKANKENDECSVYMSQQLCLSDKHLLSKN